MSMAAAGKLLEEIKKQQKETEELPLEIHVDVGTKGDTREMINEIVGMIRGSGYSVKTKPEAYGASNVADRHT